MMMVILQHHKNLVLLLENRYLGGQPGFSFCFLCIANQHLPCVFFLSRIDLTTCHKSLGVQDLMLLLLIVVFQGNSNQVCIFFSIKVLYCVIQSHRVVFSLSMLGKIRGRYVWGSEFNQFSWKGLDGFVLFPWKVEFFFYVNSTG